MTIRQALRKLYTAMCGGTTNKNTAGDLINAIADDYTGGGGGGGSLPENFPAESAENANKLVGFNANGEYAAVGGEETITINHELGNVPETSDGYVVEIEDARFAKITRASNVVINGHEMAVVADTVKVEFTYNLDLESGEPTGTPAIYFEVDEGDGATATYITDVDPSDTTLAIVVNNKHGGLVVVDSSLSVTSENPVQNKVITAALADKMDADEIPEATASNNGKILGVENGEYALVSPSALSNDYKITLTAIVDESTGTVTITADKAIADIITACEADKNVYAWFTATVNGVTVHQKYMLGTYSVGENNTGGVELYRNEVDDDAVKPVCFEGHNAGAGDVWTPVV